MDIWIFSWFLNLHSNKQSNDLYLKVKRDLRFKLTEKGILKLCKLHVIDMQFSGVIELTEREMAREMTPMVVLPGFAALNNLHV